MAVTYPTKGSFIEASGGRFDVPSRPIVAFIEGDGIGRDIWQPTRAAVEAAVRTAYGSDREISWYEVYAGEKAEEKFGTYLPDETLEAFRKVRIGIKGPLTTPVGGGFRSLNVTLRQELDLYACVRPVRYFAGVPSPLARPEDTDMVIFRENTEDVYAGIEWPSGSREAKDLIAFLRDRLSAEIAEDAGIGVKPMSPFASKRLVRRSIAYALETGRRSVTLVHKGNIQKYTEGAFRDWGYEVAREFGDRVVRESELEGAPSPGQVVVKDRIADNMFQQVLLKPREYDVIATPNLNGDYLSDAIAAQVGGIGIAPGANMSDEVAIFEATHGTAPRHAGKNEANPGSLMLSAAMMLETMGWKEASVVLIESPGRTIRDGVVTYDLAGADSRRVGTSEFARAMIDRMPHILREQGL